MLVSVRIFLSRNLSTAVGKYLSTNIEENTTAINGKTINYVMEGRGPHSVLFITGLLGSIWTHFGPQLRGLDNRMFRKVFWETPGYAKSRPPNREFHIGTHLEDADTAYNFMQELGINRYSVCGWSDGGRPSMILAAKYPQTIEKLVIWGTTSYFNKEDLPAIQGLGDINTWPEEMRRDAIQTYGLEQTRSMLKGFYEMNAPFVDRGSICEEFLKDIECPTLILHGAEDNLIPLHHAENIHSKVKGSKLIKVPKAKHFIHLKYPDEFNKIITDFLLE